MKRLLILLCLLWFAGCVGHVAESHRTTLALRMDDGTCSGTAVGKHLVLTATHCLTGQSHLAIDGKPVAVKKVINDNHDHSLVVVDQAFDHWSYVGDEPAQGDEIYVIGNPGRVNDMYRHGYVSGRLVDDNVTITLYDFNGYFGDSGSGIFNSHGQLVGVTSVLYQQQDGAYMKLMGSFSLAFTEDQWREAGRD